MDERMDRKKTRSGDSHIMVTHYWGNFSQLGFILYSYLCYFFSRSEV